jgi:2'-5' RNA ligase
MDDYRNSVMVALLPVLAPWAKVAMPHLTLAYVGEKQDLKPTDFNYLAKTAADIAMKHHRIHLMVDGFDVFGEEPNKVEVVKLRPIPALVDMRRRVADWDADKAFPFKPHVTVGPRGSLDGGVPPMVAFDRITVSWGEDNINFWLKP